MTINHTVWASARFALDLYATSVTGAAITLAETIISERNNEGHAICTLTLRNDHRNAAGAVMGGVYCTLADLATAIAMNVADCDNDPQPNMELHWVTTNCNIHFLSQPKDNVLVAEACCRKAGLNSCLYEVTLRDSNRIVGIAMLTGSKI